MWQEAPKKIFLEGNEAHLWKITLPLALEFQERIPGWLHPEEKKRAERFHFEKDRDRFAQFRGFLRYLLGQYLQKSPEKISLGENPHGKPNLSTGEGLLYFNLAHSGGTGLLFFTKLGEVGVDVEAIQDPYDGEKLAGRYFSPQESAYLTSLSEEDKAKGFFRLWTLKEAYLKAMGLGFSGGLDSFSIQIQEERGTAGLLGSHPEDRQGPWLLNYFEVGEGFVGALAAPAGVGEMGYFDGNRLEIKNAREGT